MQFASGSRLGAYEVTGSLGAGGMGEVYRAKDLKLGREVAIKTLPSSLAQERDRLVRFEREAKLLATLNHAHIASVYGLDEHEGTLYLAKSSGYPPSAWGLALAVDVNGLGADIPSSEQKTLVERFSVSDDGSTLTVRYTVNDPVYLTAPYTGTATLDRVADDAPIYEFKCELDSAARFSRDP